VWWWIKVVPVVKKIFKEACKLFGIVAHNLSGLDWSLLEVTDETDRDAIGDPEDAI
jgi:hypothetical protein